MKKQILAIIAAAGFLLPQLTLAWGPTGHRSVALLAERYLSDDAKAAVDALIGADNYMWELSTWPDEIRSDRETWSYTFPWHYISIDDHEDIHSDFPRSDSGDILWALEEMEKRIVDESLSRDERVQALAFYIHFVGDIHQPLHVGNRHDKGGNDVRVNWFGQGTNLHSVWDSRIIDHWDLSFTELTDGIDQQLNLAGHSLAHADYITWAEESKMYRDQCYQRLDARGDSLPDLGFQYAYYNKDLVEKRLRDAGYRLASKLNAMFGK